MSPIGPACVKAQKRPHVVPFKLEWISGEVGFRCKEVVGPEASQMPVSLHLNLTSTIAALTGANLGLPEPGRSFVD